MHDISRSCYPHIPLVFDIGANLGAKAAQYVNKGFHVVCVEPQPEMLKALHRKFDGNPNIAIVGKALAEKPGILTMSICKSEPTISTLSNEWKKGRFADYTWDEEIEVPVTTLDQLIRDYGIPDFCKIDVEGYELQVLKGLSQPLPFLSFEFTREYINRLHECVIHLETLGCREFNYKLAENESYESDVWLTSVQLFQQLADNQDPVYWGDVYCRYPGASAEEQPALGKIDAVDNKLIASDGELDIIRRFINKGAVVLDVGANVGDWSRQLLKIQPDLTIHTFEPVPETDTILREKLTPFIRAGVVIPNCYGVGRATGQRQFTFYRDASTWSTFYRRESIEKECGLEDAVEISIPVVTIDTYCETNGVAQIDFLKIDTEGGELDVLMGAQKMLKWGRIDYIQFEYGGTYRDAGITLHDLFNLLDSYSYGIFKILPDGVEYCPLFREDLENYQFANFLAINERLLPTYLGLPPKMLNLRSLLLKHRIKPRGIIHVGAHEGSELGQYIEMGAESVLYIEANPETYQRLLQTIGDRAGVIAVQCAISDHNGIIELHVTSMDQSSSILPLKRHLDIYPGIVEEKTVAVPCRTLDSLMAELKLDPTSFNVMNIDIQGAELLALRGAEETLRHMEAINSEVNFEELYEGCAIIWDLDAFLDKRGFDRVSTVTPYHPSWGDGFYVKRPLVTMSTLGANGRFANQIFQYAFLRIYSREHMFHHETSQWVGQQLFGHQDPPISGQLPVLRETSNLLPKAIIPNSKEQFRGVDFWGYFQYHTSYYAPHKEFFRSLLQPVPTIKAAMEEGVRRMASLGKTLVGLHLRRGDYGYDYFFVAPNRWYLDWLQELWPTLEEPVLFIASDEPDAVLADFSEYRPVTAKSLGIALEDAEYYPDFYLLSRCDITAISNSSFSFAACMLNTTGTAFFRPSLALQHLIPFDPWNSEVILRDTVIKVEEPVVPRHSILFLNNYYNAFLTHLYDQEFPELAAKTYALQERQLVSELFGDSDFYSHNIASAGWKSADIVVNAVPAQRAWAEEHHSAGEMLDIIMEQINHFSPEVVYIQDMYAYPPQFLQRIRNRVKLIVGQIASPAVPGTPFDMYDLVISSFPHFVNRFNDMGVRSIYQPLAFEPRVLSHIVQYGYAERPVACSFVGGISHLHQKGNQMLEALIARTPIQIWGYGRQSLPHGSPIHSRHQGEAWGKSMYGIMAASRITVNRHIDVAENFANNLRLFEATGCGALLITDYKDNLNDLFEIGKEVVAYRSAEECATLVNYYLDHPAEARNIAAAGQRRTLRDHTYMIRMKRLGALLSRYVDGKASRGV